MVMVRVQSNLRGSQVSEDSGWQLLKRKSGGSREMVMVIMEAKREADDECGSYDLQGMGGKRERDNQEPLRPSIFIHKEKGSEI